MNLHQPILTLALICGVLLSPLPVTAQDADSLQDNSKSIVRVNVTTQDYNFSRPWDKNPPMSQTGIGAILDGGRVLVLGELVANHTYIELEDIDTGEKAPAKIEAVDYEANLAIVTPKGQGFLEDKHPLELAEGAHLGDTLTVWQVQSNGDISPATGPVTSVELIPYTSGNSFLAFRLNLGLQYRNGNVTLPVMKDGKLAGLLLRYNSDQQTIDVIATPIIRHFLQEAEDGDYQGFPLTGLEILSMRDPALRKYLDLPEGQDGVYIKTVTGGRPAKEAGLKAGDVILEISGNSIDDQGNYEHPVYGDISLSHLVRAEHFVGDTITFHVWRDGEILEIPVTLDHRPVRDYLVPPYVIDTAPRFIIVGGVIIQELTLPYLRQFGGRWPVAAPTDLVYYQQNQDDLADEDREKIIFISAVIPSQFTIGYERISNIVISKINNKDIGSLDDVQEALKSPVDGFHKFELENDPYVFYLDPEELPQVDDLLLNMYRLPTLQNL